MEYLLTIRDFSSHQAILQDQDNNLIYWPKDKLPKDAVIGQLISFKIEAETNQSEKNLAKQILGEILGEQS
ncbi:MAG: hypothetical protein WAW11_00940 [Patescibacteria group bacterium]